EVAPLDLVGGDAELLRPGGQQAWRPLGARGPGVDAIDGDPEAAQLHGEGLGEVHERGVARAAAEVAGVARVGAADVDDAAPALLLHVRDDGAGTAQRADVLDVEVVQQVLVDHRLDGPGGGGGAAGRRAAVDQDVHAAELRGRLRDHPVHLRSAGDVGDHRDAAPPGRYADVLRRRFQPP